MAVNSGSRTTAVAVASPLTRTPSSPVMFAAPEPVTVDFAFVSVLAVAVLTEPDAAEIWTPDWPVRA